MAPCKGNCQAAFIIEECSNLSSKKLPLERTTIPSFVQDTPDSAGLGEGGGGYCGVSDRCGQSKHLKGQL